MTVTGLRIVVGIVLGLALAVAAVPLLVLLDLAGGGTGYGLCPEGITSCENPYTAAPEMAFGLTLLLFALVAVLRLMTAAVRRMERRQELMAAAYRQAPADRGRSSALDSS